LERGGGWEGASAPGRNGREDGGSRSNNAEGLINREGMLAKLMSFGLSHNSRLDTILSPCIIGESSAKGRDGAICIRPDPATRFFTDNVQHGLCIYL
jgi:hypothetical protein